MRCAVKRGLRYVCGSSCPLCMQQDSMHDVVTIYVAVSCSAVDLALGIDVA